MQLNWKIRDALYKKFNLLFVKIILLFVIYKCSSILKSSNFGYHNNPVYKHQIKTKNKNKKYEKACIVLVFNGICFYF